MSSLVGSPPSTGSSAISATTTLAPSSAKPTAMARPMPELAPVTTAIFPASKLDMVSIPGLRQGSKYRVNESRAPVRRADQMTPAIQPDINLAASLFDALANATRRGRGIVRDSYGEGEQAAHDIMRTAAATIGLEISVDAIGNLYMTLPGRKR